MSGPVRIKNRTAARRQVSSRREWATCGGGGKLWPIWTEERRIPARPHKKRYYQRNAAAVPGRPLMMHISRPCDDSTCCRRHPKACERAVDPTHDHEKRARSVGVLVYGLIRSSTMLRHTLPTLAEFVLRPLDHQVGTKHVFVHGWCSSPCGATSAVCDEEDAARSLIASLLPNDNVSIEIHRTAPRWDRANSTCRTHRPRRETRPVHETVEREMQGMLSLFLCLSAAQRWESNHIGGGTPLQVYVLARIDVQFFSPRLNLRFSRPWRKPITVFVPAFQSYGGLNDRFAYGHASALRRYVVERLRLLQERHFCWLGAELSACAVALHERLSVQYTSTRFVRIRADLSMPLVDQATVLRNLSAMRPWMLDHARVCTGDWLDQMSRAFAAEPHSWPWDNASAPVNLNFVRQARPCKIQ